MNSDTLALLVLIAAAVLLVLGVISLVVNRGGIGNFASLTAYHDFQPKDKQDAVEIVIEKKAGEKMESDKSGEGNR